MIREFVIGDYRKFASWFDEPPKLGDLPKIGLVSDDLKAVGFLYRTDSSFCIIAFWHANPENSKKESYIALKEVIVSLIEVAKLIGKQNIFITTTNRGMIRLLQSLGFYNADGHLILRIDDD